MAGCSSWHHASLLRTLRHPCGALRGRCYLRVVLRGEPMMRAAGCWEPPGAALGLRHHRLLLLVAWHEHHAAHLLETGPQMVGTHSQLVVCLRVLRIVPVPAGWGLWVGCCGPNPSAPSVRAQTAALRWPLPHAHSQPLQHASGQGCKQHEPGRSATGVRHCSCMPGILHYTSLNRANQCLTYGRSILR
jgi:hypothetical protein